MRISVLECHELRYFFFTFAGYKSVESVPKLVQEYQSGKMMVDEFITHNVKLDEINKAFDLMHAGER